MNIYIKYLLEIIIGILIYTIYIIVKHEHDKLKIIKNFALIVTSISYFSILLNYNRRYIYDISAFKAIFLAISLFLMLVSYALIKDNKNLYQKNIKYYIVLYLIILISITFFIGRASIYFKLSNLKYISIYNVMPFRSIKAYITHHVSLRLKLKNLGGNFLLFMPLAFFLMIKNDKYIILNLSGVIVFTFLITRCNFISLIKKVFYYDFLKNKYLKYTLFILSLMYPLYFLINNFIITFKYF